MKIDGKTPEQIIEDARPRKIPGHGKPSIRQNIYGNWYGYKGRSLVASFGNSSQGTAEQAANEWLRVQQAPVRKPGEWIKASEELPPASSDMEVNHVLVWFEAFGSVRTGWYFSAVGDWRIDGASGSWTITHWMPLPERPKD